MGYQSGQRCSISFTRRLASLTCTLLFWFERSFLRRGIGSKRSLPSPRLCLCILQPLRTLNRRPTDATRRSICWLIQRHCAFRRHIQTGLPMVASSQRQVIHAAEWLRCNGGNALRKRWSVQAIEWGRIRPPAVRHHRFDHRSRSVNSRHCDSGPSQGRVRHGGLLGHEPGISPAHQQASTHQHTGDPPSCGFFLCR